MGPCVDSILCWTPMNPHSFLSYMDLWGSGLPRPPRDLQPCIYDLDSTHVLISHMITAVCRAPPYVGPVQLQTLYA